MEGNNSVVGNKVPGIPRRMNSREVAAAAGVSQATVSNVLNRPDLVAPATYERVMKTIDSLDFVVNRSARALREGQGSSLGMVVLDVANPFWGELTRGVQDVAAKHGQPVIVCSSDESSEREDQFLHLLESHSVSSILISPVVAGSAAMRKIRGRGTNIVLLDHLDQDGEFDSVAVDDIKGARMAGEYLLEMGHRGVAFVNGPRSISWCRNRAAGFLEAFDRAGGDTVVHEVSVPTMTVRAGLNSVDRVMSLIPQASAVFCANDLLALGVLRGLIRRGIRVPEDVSLVGYDDSDFTEALSPALTTVRQDPYKIGQQAAELAFTSRSKQKPLEPRLITLEAELVIRESVKPWSQKGPSSASEFAVRRLSGVGLDNEARTSD